MLEPRRLGRSPQPGSTLNASEMASLGGPRNSPPDSSSDEKSVAHHLIGAAGQKLVEGPEGSEH
jgi:hypothetical protein